MAGTFFGPFNTGSVVLKIVDLCTERFSGDINNDCVVDLRDLSEMGLDWLKSYLR